MILLLALLSFIVAGMNVLNYNSVVAEADAILSVLTENRGEFPKPDGKPNKLPPSISAETPYESRFFSVFYDKEGEIRGVDIKRIASVDEASAKKYADKAISSGKAYGFDNGFRFALKEEPIGTRITFLDCGRQIDSFRRFLLISVGMSLSGFLLVFALMFVLSGRIIRPIAESYEKQKRFITDAGHEIKTPLTVIDANADILEMEYGEENESLSDIRKETKRLRTLTEELVRLSRMDESVESMRKIDFPLSEVVKDTAESFRALAAARENTLTLKISPLLSICGNDISISELVSILMENALKYSPEGSEILLTLSRSGRSILLSVRNETTAPVDRERLPHVFERFYRMDSSRNSETGGHGIGLSLAESIMQAHGGKLHVSAPDDNHFLITAVFPK